jgi:hypothetical protein
MPVADSAHDHDKRTRFRDADGAQTVPWECGAQTGHWMSEQIKALLKSAAGNVVTILGYISTGATFLPVMEFLRPYLRPFGVALIIVGIFRGALSVIKENNNQLESVRSAKDAEIETVTAKMNTEIAALNERVTELQRKPYTEELKRLTKQVIDCEMTLEGRHVLRHLMIHEPVEVGRTFLPEIPQDRTHAQLAIAKQHGIVQHQQERQSTLRTYWIINPRFRPVLEDVLYEGGNN